MKSSSKIDVQSGMNTPLGVHHKDNQTQSRSNNDAYPSPVSPSKSDENGDYSTSYNGSSMYGNSLSQSSSSHSRNIHPFYKNFCVEAIKDTLYLHILQSEVTDYPSDAHLFSVDNEFVYIPFYADYGPLGISQIVRFNRIFKAMLNDPEKKDQKLVMCLSQSPDKYSNALLLISSFLILSMDFTPEEAYKICCDSSPKLGIRNVPLVTFRDAGYGPATYWISVMDCLRALHKGTRANDRHGPILNIDDIDEEKCEFYERVENGDMNWIIPGLFLALASPQDHIPVPILRYHQGMERIQAPKPKYEPLVDVKKLATHLKEQSNVKAMIRLNNKLYDRNSILESGLHHYELYFDDGSVPDIPTIVNEFLRLCDLYLDYEKINLKNPKISPGNLDLARVNTERGGLAVHCKAGLGRTGSLICCWMMRTLGWTARETISWCRLMRPGSVVGPQQNWLEHVEEIIKSMNVTDESNIGRRVNTEQNDGTSDLATNAMGMKVPIQPRKHEIHETRAVEIIQKSSMMASEEEEVLFDENEMGPRSPAMQTRASRRQRQELHQR